MFVALKSHANNKYVFNYGATSALIASAADRRGWDTAFALLDRGNGVIALQASNGLFVCAENAGARPLIPNRGGVDVWESFDKVNVNGGIALKSIANGKYVCADNSGLAPLIANRDAVGAWETFDLVDLSQCSVGVEGPCLSSANILFSTQDDGKDSDSTLNVRVTDAGSGSLIAMADGDTSSQYVSGGPPGAAGFGAGKQQTVYLTIPCGTPKAVCLSPNVQVGMKTVGSDTWRFKIQLNLTFSDSSRLVMTSTAVSQLSGSGSNYVSTAVGGSITY